ncbi:hypothetical protein IW262DRAFT_1468929 [Armillaria fumosa]|nr:hypothetical protein IW262DRAFT_1468929 [Armillaria fumosa]
MALLGEGRNVFDKSEHTLKDLILGTEIKQKLAGQQDTSERADEEVADQEEGGKDEEDEAQEPVVEQLQVPADIIERETCYAERWQNATRYAEKALYKVLTTSIVPVITEEPRDRCRTYVRPSYAPPTKAMGILADTFFLQCGSVCAAICDNQMTIIRIPDCDFGWKAPSTILMSSRPKMFHTTIEVPCAWRFLFFECWNGTMGPRRAKGRRPRSEMKKTRQISSTSEDTVDGVEMTRKCSKANVLWKGQLRWTEGAAWLADLPSCTPGRKSGREKFGGEEKDEVDALDIDLPESDEDKSEGYA